MKDNFLNTFGFSDREFLLYKLLITRGSLTMSDIVTVSGLHRPYAYKTIRVLLDKKIVNRTLSKNKKLYSAIPPIQIRNILEEQKDEVSSKLEILQELYVAPHLETTVTHFQGKKGVMAIFSDLVHIQKKGDIFYRFTSERDTEYANTFLPKDYRMIRDKKSLERFVISSVEAASAKQKRLERALKVIPKNEAHFNQDCIQLIYRNKVAFINLTKVQGILIEDENMASFQREIFKLLYKRL